MLTALVLLAALNEPAEQNTNGAIPLDKCRASFRSAVAKEVEADFMSDFKKTCLNSPIGAPDAFLVRGKDIREAVDSTLVVVVGAGRMSVPNRGALVGKNSPLWLVAYLGRSAPDAWELGEVSQQDKTIRVRYKRTNSMDVRTVSALYVVWVPLDSAKPGRYTVEIYVGDEKEPSITRRVNVTNEN